MKNEHTSKTIATLASAILPLASMGIGHGGYVAARLLYPLPLLSQWLFDDMVAPPVILAGLQFPLYGWLAGAAIAGKWRITSAILFIIHVSAAGLMFR